MAARSSFIILCNTNGTVIHHTERQNAVFWTFLLLGTCVGGTCVEFGPTQLPVGLGLGLGLRLGLGLGLGLGLRLARGLGLGLGFGLRLETELGLGLGLGPNLIVN